MLIFLTAVEPNSCRSIIKSLRESNSPFRDDHVNMQSITDEDFLETKYERLAEVARVMTEGEAVVLVVLNGKEGTGYAVNADSGLNELLPSILRRIAKMIGPED